MGAGFPGCDCSHSNLLAHRMDRAERVTLGEKKISRRTAISHVTSMDLCKGPYLRILHLICGGVRSQRFDLRFFRPFRADLSIRKSSSFFPPLIAATSQRGFAPRPAQVSPEGLRYFGGTFLPFNVLPPPRTTLVTPKAANC